MLGRAYQELFVGYRFFREFRARAGNGLPAMDITTPQDRTWWSFRSQRNHRIHVRRTPRRGKTGEQRRYSQKRTHTSQRSAVPRPHVEECLLQDLRHAY